MVQTQPKLKTFEDYLAYVDGKDVDGKDGFYELTNGELIEMPPESDENVVIARAIAPDRTIKDGTISTSAISTNGEEFPNIGSLTQRKGE